MILIIVTTVMVVYIASMVIAGCILFHKDWLKSIQQVLSRRGYMFIQVYALGSWYTILTLQRKWIIKEIKHRIGIWQKSREKNS